MEIFLLLAHSPDQPKHQCTPQGRRRAGCRHNTRWASASPPSPPSWLPAHYFTDAHCTIVFCFVSTPASRARLFSPCVLCSLWLCFVSCECVGVHTRRRSYSNCEPCERLCARLVPGARLAHVVGW